jgi:hypothetical protein
VPVDLSGLIFVGLALIWAVVLIPKALRAHDDAAGTRPVLTSSDGARVLDRHGRSGTAGGGVPALGHAPRHTAPEHRGDAAALVDRAVLVLRRRRLAATAARRRRRVLAGLVLVTVIVGGGSIAGLLAPWAAAIPAGVVVGFLVLARVLVRRERAAWEETLRRLRGTAPVEGTDPASLSEDQTADQTAEGASEPELHVVARNDQGVAMISEVEDTSAIDAAALAEALASPAVGTLWDPLPLTLPTYVSKPRATRSVRTIDLAGPGVSNAGHDAADSALVAGTVATGEQEPPAQRAVGS